MLKWQKSFVNSEKMAKFALANKQGNGSPLSPNRLYIMNKFNIEVPFFHGFYESIYYNSDTLYNEVDDEMLEQYQERFGSDVTKDDFDIHFDEYKHEVCEAYAQTFASEMDRYYDGLVLSVEYESISSPKEYNFRTDKVYADITLAENWHEIIQKFIDDNREWLTKQIDKDWTSYDGFWSFMSNELSEWETELAKDCPDERYITYMLGYMLFAKDKEIKWNLNYYTYEDVYVGGYIYCTREDVQAE